MLKPLVGGVVGGLVGAALWAGIGHFTGYEIGWIAWGIGGLVGFGVRAMGSEEMARFDRNSGKRVVKRVPLMEPAAAGIAAALIALAAVGAGKYAVVHLALSGDMGNPPGYDERESLIASIADEIVLEREEAGRTVTFPPGKDFETAVAQEDYPPGIWSEAKARWDALPAEEQQQYAEARLAQVRMIVDAMGSTGRFAVFLSTFSLFDLLWFGLAAWTAFKMGMSIDE